MMNLLEDLSANDYPGRGIVMGRSRDGRSAVFAYFIMGRSENSRNRVFVVNADDIMTKAFDESKLTDPSLIIYSPVRVFNKITIVTNGDQTDTVYDYLSKNRTFEEALFTRKFEPDAPQFTPRISGLIDLKDKFNIKLSILKSNNGDAAQTLRFFYNFDAPKSGEGFFIHTYKKNGSPLPSFVGEPKSVEISGEIDEFCDGIWNAMNNDYRISLVVRYIDIKTGKYEQRLINKLEGRQ